MDTSFVLMMMMIAVVGMATETSAMISRERFLDSTSRQRGELPLNRLSADKTKLQENNGRPMLHIVRILNELANHEEGIAETTHDIVELVASLLLPDNEIREFVDGVKHRAIEIISEHGGLLPDTDEDDEETEITRMLNAFNPNANTVMGGIGEAEGEGQGIVGKLEMLGMGFQMIRATLDSLLENLKEIDEQVEQGKDEPTGTDSEKPDGTERPDSNMPDDVNDGVQSNGEVSNSDRTGTQTTTDLPDATTSGSQSNGEVSDGDSGGTQTTTELPDATTSGSQSNGEVSDDDRGGTQTTTDLPDATTSGSQFNGEVSDGDSGGTQTTTELPDATTSGSQSNGEMPKSPDQRLVSSSGNLDVEKKRVLLLERNLLEELVKNKLKDLLVE
ncbi:uncharacterized protein LOC128207346 [Mya arenaria]|uniref:uncharacterized protein LOC128207346 n=1 Tax=Mya arenaria TaxID=6604 RepID=UPI0022E246A4|nr:uncharacterized protein LOC128207346 [Mya arenaria]